MSTNIENIKQGVKKNKRLKFIIIAAAILIIALILFFALNPGNSSLPAMGILGQSQFSKLEKTDLKDTLALTGIVYSDDSKNVYTTLSYQVDKINVEAGDKVKKGDTLIELDTTTLLYDIETAENTLEDSKELLVTETKNKQNSIRSAENSLKSAILTRDKSQIQYEKALDDLKEAEDDVAEPFDPYVYDNAIRDNKVALDRSAEDLKDAKDDLTEAEKDFDDYTYQNAISEAKYALDDRKDDLKKAEDDLKEATDDFDDHQYRVAIESARIALNRAKTNLASVESQYGSGLYNNSGTSYGENNYSGFSNNAYENRQAAEEALEDAQKAYDDAVENLEHAQDDLIESAEDTVKNAKIANDSAQREYDRTVSDLDRARDDAVELNQDALKAAQRKYDDAKKAYDQAVTDRERAEDDENEAEEKALKDAKRTVTDSKKALETAELSIITSQNNLDEAKTKNIDTETTIKNQEISLKKLYDNLEKSIIKSTVDGTVTAVNAVEGDMPSGILMTIENDGVLYVSANVMEYNIGAIRLGQKAEITTVATKDRVFAGEVVYISPTSVSADGATSVEYEIWTEFDDVDSEEIKIGMNAFVDVITSEAVGVYAVSPDVILEKDARSYIYCNVNDIVAEIPVTLGIESSSLVEISGEGLSDGLEIIDNPSLFKPGESISEAMPELGNRVIGAGPGSGPGGQGGMMVRVR
ncbi:MAG: efflux RND transporter periplasmic adaptor subunit [Eubacterium sp.]|jgi:multidrug efflux pump subunit AcrA (membrane-fusion protein)|nr:efflux RND transporter periplasmic adaptor subunit [Eubacterium sp.]